MKREMARVPRMTKAKVEERMRMDLYSLMDDLNFFIRG